MCLVCTVSVYCVITEVAQDADAKPGPVLPTEDWAERETMISRTGWIEVHVGNNGCIVSVYHNFIDVIGVGYFLSLPRAAFVVMVWRPRI